MRELKAEAAVMPQDLPRKWLAQFEARTIDDFYLLVSQVFQKETLDHTAKTSIYNISCQDYDDMLQQLTRFPCPMDSSLW